MAANRRRGRDDALRGTRPAASKAVSGEAASGEVASGKVTSGKVTSTATSARSTRRNERRKAALPPKERVPLRSRLIALGLSMRGAWGRVKGPLVVGAKLVGVVAVVAGAIAVGRLVERHVRSSDAFAVREVTLEGSERLDREAVLSAAGIAIGENVFAVSPEEAQARLVRHPWIASATVERRLPATFELHIREHVAVAVVVVERDDEDRGTLMLLSEEGTVFKDLDETDPVDLPVVTGIDYGRFARDRAWRSSVLLSVVALLHDYRGAGLWRRLPIGEVHVEPDDGLSLFAGDDDPLYVRLGPGPYRQRLRRLRQVLDRLDRDHNSAEYVYLDNIRRPDRVTVRLR
jgi:cell division protein FtsQ